jgi:hypothetical protein
MVENLKKLLQQLKDFDTNPVSAQPYDLSQKAVKMSLARKRELLFQVLKISQTLNKVSNTQLTVQRDLMSMQAPIVEFVFLLTKYGCGASMIREMSETLQFLYTQGGDFTKVMAEFFEPAIQLINNAKTPSLQRLIFIELAGKLFKSVWTRCPNPPTKDLFEAFTKSKAA